MCESIVTSILVMPVLLALRVCLWETEGKDRGPLASWAGNSTKSFLEPVGAEESLLRAERWLICHP